MRNLLILFIVSMTLNSPVFSQSQSKSGSDALPKVTVYFFHGTHRCTGCINAEKATVSVLNDLYKNQQDQGIVRFQSVNIEEAQNKALSEKYQIAWNTLLIVPAGNEKGKVELTEKAFAYGTSPEELKPHIKAAIDPMLK